MPIYINDLVLKYQTTQLNVWREYCQSLFLARFYEQKGAEKIYFKGGTALRLVFGSPRFSQDLDFDLSVKEIPVLKDLITGALLETERDGWQTKLLEAKKTSGGFFSQIEFDTGEAKIEIELNFSARKFGLHGEIMTVAGDFLPSFTLVILKETELVREKIAALLFRQKPRDFYDLYFMLRKNLVPVSDRKELEKVKAVIKKTKINFAGELKEFLPKNQWMIIRDFKLVLEREIEKH